MFVIILIYGFIIYIGYKILKPDIQEPTVGTHTLRAIDSLRTFTTLLRNRPWKEMGIHLKKVMHPLSKRDFNAFKVFGTWQQKRTPSMASRGYMKLADLVLQSGRRPIGKVLNLCAGAGGWEQYYTQSEFVTSATAVTFGDTEKTQGHKNFTDQRWEGREKVSVIYADAREFVKTIDPTDYDTLLFDGGEMHNDPEVERAKFEDLFTKTVVPVLGFNYKTLILKILRPDSPVVLSYLHQFQEHTGSGRFYMCRHSRNSNLELYFINSRPPLELTSNARHLLIGRYENAHAQPYVKPPLEYERFDLGTQIIEPSPFFEDLQEKDMTAAINRLGQPLSNTPTNFNHWRSLGVYPFGTMGSSNETRNEIAHQLVKDLLPNIPTALSWTVTDTTPEGFIDVFRSKIDKTPLEGCPLDDALFHVYMGISDHLREKGFFMTDLKNEEILAQANKAGAPGPFDIHHSVRDFLETPSWDKHIEATAEDFLSPTPHHGIFMTMGKREKKKKKLNKKVGSRMVAYMGIPERLTELKYFGRLMDAVKPHLNPAGVCGLGLHDYGERLKEIYKDCSVSDDVAAWDTRVSRRILSMELAFINSMCSCQGRNCRSCVIRKEIYRVFAFPHILIPYPGKKFVRSELLKGVGQRMSGTNVTYSMNTLTNLALTLLQIAKTLNLDLTQLSELRKFSYSWMGQKKFNEFNLAEWGIAISGDDKTVSSTRLNMRLYAKSFTILNEFGFYRKDIGRNAQSPLESQLEDITFCSHSYRKISYYDSYRDKIHYRYMPVRHEGEIVAKSTLWLGGSSEGMDAEAWISMQGTALLVNYHHLRTARILGLAYRASVNPYLILTHTGATYLPKPWMREGHIIDTINECLFGDSTAYPVPDFYVRHFHHFGYVDMTSQITFNENFLEPQQRTWRRTSLLPRVMHLAYVNGGDISFMYMSGLFR